jgi:hypothetical protein
MNRTTRGFAYVPGALALIALSTALCGAISHAQTAVPLAQVWSGPDPARRPFLFGHAVENFDISITEICLPFLVQDVAANTWVRQRRPGVAWFPPGGPFVGLTPYLVGGAAGAIVGVGNRIGQPECTVKGDSVEPEIYLAAASERLGQLGFTPLPPESVPSSEVGERRVFCGPAEGTQFVAVVTIDARGRGRAETLLTLLKVPERDIRCQAVPPQPAPQQD